MTNGEITTLRAALIAKRLDIAAQLRGRVKELAIEDSHSDLVDRIQRMTDRDAVAGMLNQFSSTLADIERCLDAIDEGSYGTCTECEEPISLKRLHSIPWAAYCVRCQERREMRSAQAPKWHFDESRAA